MNSSKSDISKHLLAYFSHSYRPDEKNLNLFFWNLLSEHNLYFTVDSKEKNIAKSPPMDITYLEWMMRRSVCFVAVIPYRENLPPYNCSPYQVFENSLALRAKKPRLIFVEEGLDDTIFGAQPAGEEVCFFRRRPTLLEEDKEKFARLADRLAKKVRTFTPPGLGGKKPVALLVDTGADIEGEAAYSSATTNFIRRKVRAQGFTFKPINPNEFEQNFLFLREIEHYSVLISEVRPPYIMLDMLGLAHSQCIPTIPLCHIKDTEKPKELKAAMHLPFDEDEWSDQYGSDLPIIFRKYQIDDDMEPVIFWGKLEDLGEKLSVRLKKINEKRVDLITEQEARRYFLRIGRKDEQIFISNASTQNNFAIGLGSALKQEAVKIFHYKEEDAIKIGYKDWYPAVIREIKNSVILIALVDHAYLESRWCMRELRQAMLLSKEGRIKIYAYLFDEEAVQLPKHMTNKQKIATMAKSAEFDEGTYQNLIVDFYKMQLEPMESISDPSYKIKRILEHSINFLEKGEEVKLTSKDRSKLIGLLTNFPLFTPQEERKMLLRDAGLPKQFIEKVRIKTQESGLAAEEIVDDLAGFKEEVKSGVKALGLLLAYLVGLMDSDDDKMFLIDLIQYYELMPESLLPKREENFGNEMGPTTRKGDEKASDARSVQIFLSHASEDKGEVKKLYRQLREAGYKPWMDSEDIVGGENWDYSIRKAIKESGLFLACLTSTAVTKRGYFQKEIGWALDLWEEKLQEDIYLIPVRLEKCDVPERLSKLHKVDLFQKDGLERLLKAIEIGIERRSGEESQ